ncbi:hypothetical protein HJG60_009933 [Phyllostomus discolor]|uniref:Uncharacterized protein n=1 Tax=Phyllostomus discolor TaxID=89673 RepID=A0A834B2Y6_9CHIR|nr:hypothetical protein HJG60_009933 [Phyllostomus discolor]
MGKGPEQTLFKEDLHRAHRHMKGPLASLAIREMQIKTTMRYHFTPVRMAIINKLINRKCWLLVRLWRKGNPSMLLVGVQTGTASVENSLECPQKTKMELLFDLEIPLLGLYTNNAESPIQKNLCTPMFIAVLLIIAKCWKQPKCASVNE